MIRALVLIASLALASLALCAGIWCALRVAFRSPFAVVTPNPVLIIRLEAQGVEPTLEDPEELAYYFLDPDCDDPSPALISAEWAS